MNEKIEKLLLYVGSAGAIISALAYLIIMVTLVVGIEIKMLTSQLLIISIAGALAGLMITNMLRTQGVALAANTEESKKVMSDYHRALNKTKKGRSLRTIKFHMIKELITDVLTKVLTVATSTYFMVSVFMEGSGDFSLIFLALANILMFISFGILALRKAYKYYSEEHLAAIREITARLTNIPVEVETAPEAIDISSQLGLIVEDVVEEIKIKDQVGSVPLKEN